MIEIAEVLGLVASLGTVLLLLVGPRKIPARTLGPLVALLCILLLNHVANLLESRGAEWADIIADHFSIVTPLLWGLFLLETGRSYLAAQVDAGQQQLRFFLEQVPAAVASVSHNGIVQATSADWQRQFPDCPVGRPLSAGLPAGLSDLHLAIEQLTRHAGEERSGQQSTDDRADGQPRHFRWSMRSWSAPQQDRPNVLIFVDEFTAEAADREQKVQAAAQLARLHRMGAIGQLAAGAAHDFNNLLQIISAAAMELRHARADAQAVRSIEDAVKTAAVLTTEMRRCGSSQVATFDRVDLTSLMVELQGPLGHALGPRHELKMQTPPGDPVVIDGNSIRLKQALLNLVVNARDAMPTGGSIEVSVHREQGDAIVKVRDTGTGITPETRAQLFTPFFTTKGDAGTGLGLGVVQSAVQEHSGTISVESVPGQGSTFSLTLPLVAKRRVQTQAAPPTFGVSQSTP